MKIRSLVLLSIVLLLTNAAIALSIRSLGMGNIYSPAAHDPSGIFYNPAFLARNDSLRLSFDNILGPIAPRNNATVSLGDLGLAGSLNDQGTVYYLASGFNTYSFLRLGVGVKAINGRKDFDFGLDWDVIKNVGLSAAVLNEDNAFLPQKLPITLSFKTDDGDKSLIFSYDGNPRVGYENQISAKAFWRVGYNADHPTAGLTIPLGQNIDIDTALDLAPGAARLLWGIELFRNTENKRVNSNHSINFGAAIVGEDKFITIEGYNLHYVDAGKGFPLILLGGGIHFTHHWDPYMEEFTKHYRVINIDHLGAGESDKPQYFFGYTIEEQAELINALLDKLGIKECYLLGYCYGGSMAFYLAGQYPERYKKLVVIEGFVRGINAIPISDRDQYRLGALAMRHDVEYLNAYLLRDVVTFHYRLLYPYFNGKMWYQLNKAVLYADLRDKIRDLKAPVLYYAGTKSWAYDFLGPTKDYIKHNVKDLKFIEIEGAGHDVDRFDQRSFETQVLDFLR
ncbi:MAG: alpha/beta hydrolase [Candidatus Margulisbacteria bacterium]|nr:alpha/beta hydrolase [Candidatus Margulisiibacteriota bacterium]